jgi:hypothetical protein
MAAIATIVAALQGCKAIGNRDTMIIIVTTATIAILSKLKQMGLLKPLLQLLPLQQLKLLKQLIKNKQAPTSNPGSEPVA